jgi:drug/metabolite transporter (DMT)-like permease
LLENTGLLRQAVLWVLFVLSSVYGHVALKLAVDGVAGDITLKVWKGITSLWGVTAILSWTASAILWMMVLSGTGLLRANSISALRYVMVSAAAAWFLKEPLTGRTAAGMVLITGGLLLIGRE